MMARAGVEQAMQVYESDAQTLERFSFTFADAFESHLLFLKLLLIAYHINIFYS